MTKKDLLKQIKDMQRFGDDLVRAIEDANWEYIADVMRGPTHHMRSAVLHWKEKDSV